MPVQPFGRKPFSAHPLDILVGRPFQPIGWKTFSAHWLDMPFQPTDWTCLFIPSVGKRFSLSAGHAFSARQLESFGHACAARRLENLCSPLVGHAFPALPVRKLFQPMGWTCSSLALVLHILWLSEPCPGTLTLEGSRAQGLDRRFESLRARGFLRLICSPGGYNPSLGFSFLGCSLHMLVVKLMFLLIPASFYVFLAISIQV